MKIKSFFLSLALLQILISCSEAPKPVIFDTDWWTDVDDACALRLLLQEESRYHSRGFPKCHLPASGKRSGTGHKESRSPVADGREIPRRGGA